MLFNDSRFTFTVNLREKYQTHLFLREPEARRDLNSAQPRQIHVGGELSLQLQELCACEGRADTFTRAATARLVASHHGARAAACCDGGGATNRRT